MTPRRMEGGRCSHKDRQGGKEKGHKLVALTPMVATPSLSRSSHLRASPVGIRASRVPAGDHLGVFPGNHEDLVNALIEAAGGTRPCQPVGEGGAAGGAEHGTAGNYGQASTPPRPLPRALSSSRSPRSCLGLPFPGGGVRESRLLPSCQSRQESGSLSPPAYETEGSLPHG